VEIALLALAWTWLGKLAADWTDFHEGGSTDGVEYLRWALVATPLQVALVGIVLAARGRRPSSIGWSRPRGGWLRAIGAGLAWGVALVPISWAASGLAGLAGLERAAVPFSIDGTTSWAAFVAGGLLAGAFAEELFYRGWLLERVERLLEGLVPSPWVTRIGIAASALAFGASHAWQGGAAVAGVTVLGLGLGMLFVRSGRNLVAAVVAHGVLDVVALTLLHLGT
jgi:membrane protease YdiL (CAAX protease family)